MEKQIIVTNWERVPSDDFYLSDEWLSQEGNTPENKSKLREMANNNELSYAYIVPAVNYAIYWQMDAQQVIINHDWDILVWCEGTVIDTEWRYKQEYEY